MLHGRSFASVCARRLLPALLSTSMIGAPVLSVTSIAFAQDKGSSAKDLEMAKKKFFEGLDFEKANNWEEALKRFQDVAAVRMTPQVRFHIALCEENLGQLIEAAHDYELAEKDAKASKVATVAAEAPERAAAVKAKIPKLKLRLPSDVESVAVTLDGSPIDAGADELPINPGTHKIEATSDKRTPFSQSITLEPGQTKTVAIRLPIIGKPEEEKPPPPKEEPKKPQGGGIPLSAVIVGSTGVAALIAGGVFGLLRNGVKSDLDAVCQDVRCPPGNEDKINSGKTYTLLTNVFVIVGIVGVGTGVVLWAAAPRSSAPKDKDTPETKDKAAAASLRLMPSAPGANVGGFSLVGSF